MYNNQSAFIFVNYNILLKAPGSERKATGLAQCPKYVTKRIKVGFRNIRVGAHAHTQVKLSLFTPYRDTGKQTYNSLTHYSSRHSGGDDQIRPHLPRDIYTYYYYFLWLCSPARAMTSFTRFLDHTKRRVTVGRTTLDG
jgi:hypothetical protein